MYKMSVVNFIKKEIKKEFRAFGGLVFPRRCIVCGETLDVTEKWICGVCEKDFPYTWFWAFEENPAEERLWKRIGVVAAASLFFYRKGSGYAELLHEVKYGGNLELGRRLGRELGERLRDSGRFAEVQAVVPVPLHPLRRWRRGYNQAEVIAQGIAEGLYGGSEAGPEAGPETGSEAGPEAGPETGPEAGPETGPEAGPEAGPETGLKAGHEAVLERRSETVPEAVLERRPEARPETGPEAGPEGAKSVKTVNTIHIEAHLLRRNRYTRTQTRLSGEGKRRNVQNAFALNLREAERLKREGIRHILVVDDILTSGSTLEAACKPLMPHFLVSVATVGFVE